MLLHCKYCNATVDAKDVGSFEHFDEDLCVPEKVTLAKCPCCSSPLLYYQNDLGDGWDNPTRLYPATDDSLGWSVPDHIRRAFVEAQSCLRAAAPTAAAIMCRKTIEGVCHDNKAKGKTLKDRLKSLKQTGVIEGKLFDWSDELRLVGNEAAHDTLVVVDHRDASDTLEFARALLEYVYTFRHKFEEFRSRREARKVKAPRAASQVSRSPDDSTNTAPSATA